MSAKSPSILLAEDEESDVMMFQLALKRGGMSFPVIITRDGQEAVDYLSGRQPYQDRTAYPLPSLIILDLKMPRLSGFDVLSWLNSSPDIKQIPAVVLSSSSYAQDIHHATQLGAREYYIKPHSVTELSRLLQTATTKWLGA
jgi:CheY-like chemotaxis protein